MKWIADITSPMEKHAEIEWHKMTSIVPEVEASSSYFLAVWENGHPLADEVQDDWETAVEGAFKRYGIPRDAWKKVEE